MRIGIIGCGMMGAAVGELLQARGAEVLMLLDGRSDASRQRAASAGLSEGSASEVGACDMVLSIVPPDAAEPVVETILPHLAPDTLFVECNAVDPDVARKLCAQVAAAGHACADAGIIGPAPSPDGKINPVFYTSGAGANATLRLADFGLDIAPLDAPFGSASALKMTFAGVSKGVTGLMAQMLLYAQSEQVLEPALAQLRRSQPGAVAWAERQFPLLDRKAGRWVQEMEIIAELGRDVQGCGDHFTGMAELYRAIAADPEGLLSGLLPAIKNAG